MALREVDALRGRRPHAPARELAGRIAANQRTNAMVSWIDILPTLVEAAGGTAPTEIDGRSFLPVLEGKVAKHRDFVFTTHSGDGNFNVYPMRGVIDEAGDKYLRNLHPEFRFTSHVTKNTGTAATGTRGSTAPSPMRRRGRS